MSAADSGRVFYEPIAQVAAESAALDFGLPDLGVSVSEFQALFSSLITTESDWRMVENPESGAFGLTQLMPGTAAELGVNPRDPYGNIAGGATYLAKLVKKFNGDIAKALTAYGGFVNTDPTAYIEKVAGGAGLGEKVKESASWIPDWIPAWLRELFTLSGFVTLIAAAILFFGGIWIVISSQSKGA